MAHTKSGGSANNLKDSAGKRLGVKLFSGEKAQTGDIIVRQRGLTKLAGPGTKLGRDFTIFAMRRGKVAFRKVKKNRFSGHRVAKTQVEITD